MTSAGYRSLVLAVLATTLGILVGCASAGSEPKVGLLRVNVPLREPVWVPEKEVVLALSEDRRQVVRVDVGEAKPGSQAPVRSEGFEGAGENLALSPEEPDLAYLPRPDLGRISALDTDTLRVVDSYDVGDSPTYATLDVQSEVLFALSEDGSTVFSVELETSEELRAAEVGGGPQTLVEAPDKGLDPAFWVAGPGGVAFYGGNPPERLVGRPVEATDIAVDLTSSQLAYVAEADRVVALEGDPERFLEGKLEVVATRSLGEKVEHVASDELHVFAATKTRLVVMRRETLEPVETVDFSRLLDREGIRPAGISGITAGMGGKEVYLTLEGEPYVLSVEKP
jgi:hypothetical protein